MVKDKKLGRGVNKIETAQEGDEKDQAINCVD
jgi:hypothetical protein